MDINCVTRPSLCGPAQFCDESTDPPTCQERDDTCLNPEIGCEGATRCNPASGSCVPLVEDGSPCDFDAECPSDRCFLAVALRLDDSHLDGHEGICARTCCADTDCPENSMCFASGTGARACIPRSVLELGEYGVPDVSPCAARDDCDPSGCVLSSIDAYTLPNLLSTQCEPVPVESCFVARIGSWVVSDSCDADFSGDAFCLDGACGLETCETGDDCPTGICVGNRCRQACGATADCAATPRQSPPHCNFVFSEREGRRDYVAACSFEPSGLREQGEACDEDRQCRDWTCVDESGNPTPPPGARRICANTCCSDAHCGDELQCRPIFVHGRWEMHCLPSPLEPLAEEE